MSPTETVLPTIFLSTLSLRRATRRCGKKRHLPAISIHALLAESDTLVTTHVNIYAPISIHALLAESDMHICAKILKKIFLSTLSLRRATKVRPLARVSAATQFLSTLSLRRATSTTWCSCPYILNFYPRSPCGERHLPAKWQKTAKHFYPRSPCGERHISA